jgi:glycosyltransferase involved in cell wall biosynthesis
MSKKVLFISHDASRTGAPIIFLNFLSWFKKNTSIPFEVLLKKADGSSGTLKAEFEAIAPVSVFHPEKRIQSSLFVRILKRFGFRADFNQDHLQQLQAKLSQANIGLIYTNTITNGNVLEFLSTLQCPVICHVHELEYWVNHRVSPEDLERVKKHTHHYIVVSEAVKKNLVENQGISQEKISVVYAAVPIDSQVLESALHQRERIRQQLNIPSNAGVVCASGTTDWRKGADLFIQLARTVCNQEIEHPIYFLWVGGQKEGLQYAQLQHDIKHVGLEKQVFFLGEQSNPLEYFAACDVFVLTSREDPYPLVCLEAASLGKPVICFDHSGGEPEFVEDDCGFVVPYLDIATMATKVITLINSPELRERLGSNAKRKVETRHRIEDASAQIAEIIATISSKNSLSSFSESIK